MRIVSWNVNGIRSVYKKGYLNIESLGDIVCIQETKASPNDIPKEIKNITGFKSFFSSPIRKGYSGVAVYTKIEPKNVSYSIGRKDFDEEGRVIILEFDNFYLFNIYFPNGKASPDRLKYKMDFYNHFLEYIENFRKNIIICCDLNTAHKDIDLARPKENENVSGFLPEEREWIDNFLKKGFIDTFRFFNKDPGHYTWWDYKTRARERNIGWRIDYIFINEDLKTSLKNSTILTDIMGSDHCPVAIDIF